MIPPFYLALGLLTGFIAALISCAMLALVLWQDAQKRENQWIAVYFGAIFLWGIAAFFTRVQGLLGGSIHLFIYLAGIAAQLTALSLFILLSHGAQFSKRLFARLFILLGLVLLLLNLYFYATDQALTSAYMAPDGSLIYKTSTSGTLSLLTMLIFGIVNSTLAIYHRKKPIGRLLTGTLCCSAGIMSVSIPQLRAISSPVLLASISTIFFARVVLSKNLFDPLSTSKQKAERASAAKTMFLARMGHELRTPLNTIMGYCELATEEIEEGNIKNAERDLNKVLGAGKHLLSLVEEVIDIGKIEEGKLKLAPANIELCSLVQSLKELMTPLSAKNNNEFKVIHKNVDPSICLYQDPTRLRQILVNLLGNAAKFTESGTITLEIQGQNKLIVFRVLDTGIGMSKKQQERIFEEFEQAHQDVEKRYGGAGLGLSISHKLSQLMGGSLSCTSEEGKGSAFELRLPQRLETAS